MAIVVGKACKYRRDTISPQPDGAAGRDRAERRAAGDDASRDPAIGPGLPGPAPDSLDRAVALVRFLRAGCPWDAAQTPRSLIPYLLEEAHEVADAIAEERDADLPGELGDLLLNLAFQVVLAEERGAFGAGEVVGELESKMRRRHPQLYGEGEAVDWETLKAREHGRDSLLSGLAKGLDPLTRAHRIQERVASVGFDWADAHGAFAKVAEELEEVRSALERVSRGPSAGGGVVVEGGGTAEGTAVGGAVGGRGAVRALEEELGDLLFAVVNLTRLAGTHALHALGRANVKFAGRFAALERLAKERGVELGKASLQELDALWDEVKVGEGEGVNDRGLD